MTILTRWLALLTLAALSACAGSRPGSTDRGGLSVECAPYARRLTGLPLYGPAASWWPQAAGRFRQAQAPRPGAVLVFRATPRLPSGHVSVVSRVLSPRRILVDQANWEHHRIDRDAPVVDVSAANDWSLVRVWWNPIRAIGNTVYPAYGFVGPDRLRIPREWMPPPRLPPPSQVIAMAGQAP